ncbi:hypothetical protein PROFUN_11629 [Planoprotostelium fungivorum]|uniref:Uncharacterized protein n=1 Tax=Planoprotostelium fungivorum TaxID=1890364 RepID=A0A2P6N9Q8_9EUKA|nr:hypothetical protein PROFUN_11629 [Planoprotostelium fungivorum]
MTLDELEAQSLSESPSRRVECLLKEVRDELRCSHRETNNIERMVIVRSERWTVNIISLMTLVWAHKPFRGFVDKSLLRGVTLARVVLLWCNWKYTSQGLPKFIPRPTGRYFGHHRGLDRSIEIAGFRETTKIFDVRSLFLTFNHCGQQFQQEETCQVSDPQIIESDKLTQKEEFYILAVRLQDRLSKEFCGWYKVLQTSCTVQLNDASKKLELYDVPKKVDCMDIPYLFRANLSVYRIGVIPRIGRLCIGVDEKYGSVRGGIDTHRYSEECTIDDEDLEESFDEDWEESDPPLRFFSNDERWEDQRADGRMIEPDLDDMVDMTRSDALKIVKDIAIICSARKYGDDFYTRLYKQYKGGASLLMTFLHQQSKDGFCRGVLGRHCLNEEGVKITCRTDTAEEVPISLREYGNSTPDPNE